MVIQAQADGNVPFIGPRARYIVVGNGPTVHSQVMVGSQPMTGVAPALEVGQAAALDPVVKAGFAKWANLAVGGLFQLGSTKKGLIIDNINMVNGTPAGLILNPNTGQSRAIPTSFPFKMFPYEQLQFIGAASGGPLEVDVTVRIDVDVIN